MVPGLASALVFAPAVKQPVARIDYHSSPMPAFRRGCTDISGDAHGGVPAADRTVRDQRVAVACRRYFCRSRRQRDNVLEVAIEGGDTGHERVPGVERP